MGILLPRSGKNYNFILTFYNIYILIKNFYCSLNRKLLRVYYMKFGQYIKFFNYTRLSLSQTVKTSGFRFYLSAILKVTSQYKSNLEVFIRTYFIYQCFSVVIILLLSFALLI